MNWFGLILLTLVSVSVKSETYQILVEYATGLKDEYVYGYVKIYGYDSDKKEKALTTKTIDEKDAFDEWDETVEFEDMMDNIDKYESFEFKLYDKNDECLGETDRFYVDEITKCDEYFSVKLEITLNDKEYGLLFVAFAKDCDSNDNELSAECLILPNDIFDPYNEKFASNDPLSNVRGRLSLTSEGDKTRIRGTITGLPAQSYHGFHVHTFGDMSEGCDSTQGHYNPFDESHGAPDDKERHIGDLGNIYSDKNGIAEVDILDEMVQLAGDNNVIGRAIVVHELEDDLKPDSATGNAGGRPACGLIGIATDENDDSKGGYNSGKSEKEKTDGKDKGKECNDCDEMEEDIEKAICILLPNENEIFDDKNDDKKETYDMDDKVRGFVHLEVKGDEIIIVGEISGLEPNSKHGFHIHEFGNVADSCDSTGGHYNPFDESHGGPNDKIRHVGDLGNIEANSKGVAFIDISDEMVKLNGDTSVIGRAFVVHEDEDDLKPDTATGNAGGRLACGVIGIAETEEDEKK